jgi:hypothetical protein
MRVMERSTVAENKEQVAPNIEQLRASQPLGSGRKEQPSNSVKKQSWYEMAMQDAQEQEASRSMIKGKSSHTGPSEMAGIVFVSEGAANQVDWREGMVADLIAKIEPPSGCLLSHNLYLPKSQRQVDGKLA